MGWFANLFNSKPVKESVAPDKAQALRKLQENVQNYPDFFSSLMDRYYSNGEWWSPVGAMPMLGGTSNKTQGRDTYAFYTEQDLRFQRDACRLLFAREPVAKAIEGHLNAFVIGKGFSYKICPKKDFEDEYQSDDAKKRLSQYQQQIDDWMDAQKWPEREQECYTCKVVDGEFFLWVKVYKGEINIRRLEPEHIQNKPGASFQDGWYLGVKYDLRDIETPIAYGYKPDYVEWQEIPADQIIHYKANVTRNVARGISDFYPITDDLNSIAQLSDNLRAGAAARAEIAYMWSVKNATPAAISGFADEQKDRSSVNPVTGKTNRYKGSRAGKAVAHGDNVEFTTMPQGDVEGSVSALQASLRVVGNRFSMPEYMISGDASNANYASTQMAGTPFVRKVEIEQNLLKRPFKQIFDMVLKQAAVAMVIPTSELVKLDIEIECTSPVIEDEYQQAQMYDIMRRNGVLSPQKWCQNKGLDYEEVQRDINEWNEANMQAPDLGSEAGTQAFGAQQQEKQQQQDQQMQGGDGLGMAGVFQESVQWEERKHPRASDGRFGHVSGTHGGKANVVSKSDLDTHIKASKKKELYRGVPKKEHAEQFKTGELRQGNGAYGPGIYVGYGYNGRDTANNIAGDEGHMARMALSDDAKVITWDKAETTWEKEAKQEYSIEKHGSTEGAIAAWAKDQGYDAIDVEHNEFMNVLNSESLVVEDKDKQGQPMSSNAPDSADFLGDYINDPENASKMVTDVPPQFWGKMGSVLGKWGKGGVEPYPITFYHGTNKQFDKFDDEKGNGWISFTTDHDHAENFGSTVHQVYLNVRNPIDLTAFDDEDDRTVDGKAVYEVLSNYGFSLDAKHFPDEVESINDILTPLRGEIKKQAKELGYDGIVRNDFKDDRTAQEVVVFEPGQILKRG